MHRQYGVEKCMQNFSYYLKGKDNVGDLGIDGRIILKFII
jgi:hypothetical protein